MAVVAVVVADVRAGAQQPAHGAAERGHVREDLRDRVEPGAAARAEQDLLVGRELRETAVRVEGGGQRDEPAEPRADPFGRGVRDLALVSGDPHQAQRGHGGHRVGDRRAVLLRPGAGACALPGAQLDDDVDGAHGTGRAQGLVHQLDPAHRVDVAGEGEVRVGVQLAGEPAEGDGVDDLVGEEDPADAVGPVHPRLVRDGGRDAPGAVVQLTGEELRGHRRLAVRGEGQSVPLGVRLQEGEVRLDGLGGQRQYGRGEPAGEQVPAFGGQGADGQPLGVGRQPLEAVVDAFTGECGERGGLLLGGQGSLLGEVMLQSLQRALRISLGAV